MKNYARTDLACECMDENGGQTEGIEQSERMVGDFLIRTARVVSEERAGQMGIPCGTYLTVECGRISVLDRESEDLLVRLLAGELGGIAERVSGKRLDSELSVFVAGLGNASLTADAIGPQTVSKLTVTRHLREHETDLFEMTGCCALSALAPGVLGQTGIETLEIMRGAIECVDPDVVIAIDALAARDCDRLAATVQISDVGIIPGSGVGNHRGAITRETLGVPVIAVGVPTVVDSSTLVYDALTRAGITSVEEPLRRVLENGRSFFVSLKESDLVTDRVATILSRAIGMAFAEDLSAL